MSGCWIQAACFVISSGAIIRQTGVIIDISARKKVAESLSRQTDLIELSFEPIFVWHPEKGIVDWNRGAEQLYGFTREEALGQISHKLLRTIHPIEPADLMQLLNTVRSWTGEVQQLTKDGRQVFVESRHQAIETDGEILILETNHDITERKRAEAETARMAAVAAASQDALFGATLEGYIEAWNPAAERLFGYTAAEAIGQHIRILAAPADHRDQKELLGSRQCRRNHSALSCPPPAKGRNLCRRVSGAWAGQGAEWIRYRDFGCHA